jgi:ribosome-binding protein aMBF1 (putative translation factor)
MPRKTPPPLPDREALRQQLEEAEARVKQVESSLTAADRARKQQARTSFGRRLKVLREQQDLSLLDLEKSSGITTSNLSRYETGQRLPTWAAVLALADALGCSTEEFRENS